MRIHIDGIGYRDTKADRAQILWYWKQRQKMLSANQRTAYFLFLKKTIDEKLIECEDFELIQFISENITKSQEDKKRKQEEKAIEEAKKQAQEIKALALKTKSRQHLLQLINKYNTPN